MTPPEWEEMMRVFILRREEDGQPVGTKKPPRARLAQVAEEEETSSEPTPNTDVPQGWEDEEWMAALYAITAATPRGYASRKVGKGARPCYVCGLDGHSWVHCTKKKNGRCGTCGSQQHDTRNCWESYRPDPACKPPRQDTVRTKGGNARSETPGPAPTALRAAQGVEEEEPAEVTEEMEEVKAASVICYLPPGEDTDDITLLRQACVTGLATDSTPGWLQKRLDARCPRERTGKPLVPLKNPATSGQLIFQVQLEGKPAQMLYDPGATHCFLDLQWTKKHGLMVHDRPRVPLQLFVGTSRQAVQWTYSTANLLLGDTQYHCQFLVLEGAPSDIVLGFNFLNKHQPEVDYSTMLFWNTTPVPNEPKAPPPVTNDELQTCQEDISVTTCDVVEPAHLRNVQVLSFGKWFPYWDDDQLHLYSVTAGTEEEEEQLQQFYSTLDPDLLEVVRKHEAVFAPPDREPPSREVKHEINLLPDAVPVKRRPYPLPPHKLEAMRTQIRELATNGWIEHANSPWGAPILFVPKKNGELRMCVDYRDLNSVTIDDSFPLPRIEVMLHRAAQATVFSKLDLASGFHQIEVEPASRALTAFRLPEGVQGSSLWQWKVMPFGLRNAPPTFQRAMTQALSGLDYCAVVYIDDILIFSENKAQHMEHLDQVFTALSHQHFHVRLPKCEFLQTEVEFLGHKLTSDGISAQPEKVDALQGWKTPFTTPKQVKSFLGAFAWHQGYIAHFATLAAPLFALTSVKKDFQWTEECEDAVRRLKEAMNSAPVLVRWQTTLPTRVVTDASKVGVGAALEQLHPEGWRPVAFWSRKLRDPETRYSATDLEWLAVVSAVTRVWHWFLEGISFKICSDHKALGCKLHQSRHDPPLE